MNQVAKKILFLCFFFSSNLCFAQLQEYLHFNVPKNQAGFVHGFTRVTVVDKRKDTAKLLGNIRSVYPNKKEKLLTKNLLAEELQDFYFRLSQGSKKQIDQTLLVVINKFAVEEDYTRRFNKQAAKFVFAADYFIAQNDQQYMQLGAVDTTIAVSAKDITAEMIDTINRSLCTIYESFYLLKNDSNLYSKSEAENYENAFKKFLPAYNRDTFAQAIFACWNDFLQLKPTSTAQLYRKGNLFGITYVNEKGKTIYQPYVDGKVLACGGRAYYNFLNSWYELYKKDNDFYITAKTQKPNGGVMVGAGFGVAGALMYTALMSSASGYSKMNGVEIREGRCYEFRVDSRKGMLIPIAEIKKDKRK